MTNQNGVKCYKSLSCIISVLVIVFIFGAIIIDLAWTKPSIRQDISEINKELVIINSQIDRMDSLQTSTNRSTNQSTDKSTNKSTDKSTNKGACCIRKTSIPNDPDFILVKNKLNSLFLNI